MNAPRRFTQDYVLAFVRRPLTPVASANPRRSSTHRARRRKPRPIISEPPALIWRGDKLLGFDAAQVQRYAALHPLLKPAV